MTSLTSLSPLDGKKALVTGGSRGIGAAIALRLAEEGADVAVTYVQGEEAAREVVAKIEAMGRRGFALRADLGRAAEATALVGRAAEALGGLDVLVNNAGVGVLAPLGRLSPDDIDRVLDVNVRGVFLTARAAADRLPRGGRIITIGSCMAERVPGPGGTLYGTSKAALIGLTKGLARELGARGINATLVHPGPIDTDMNPSDGPTAPAQSALTSLGRYGTPAEVASVVAFLAGPDASYVTGTALSPDGGYAA
ncbi:SDR family NAD(P)-dependent oxidoreductase [Streptomyces sp. NPDC055808]